MEARLMPEFLRYHRKVCAINESFRGYVTQTCDLRRRGARLANAKRKLILSQRDIFRCGFLNEAQANVPRTATCNLCSAPYLTTDRRKPRRTFMLSVIQD